MKTMAFLRRHFMKLYLWYDSFFRLGELQNIIMILHVYAKSIRDQLFFEIMPSQIPEHPFKSPVVEYFVLIGKKKIFFSAPLVSILTIDFRRRRQE